MVKFFYNDRNQRFKKESYNSSGALLNTTYYVRDLAGSILAVYMKSSLGNVDLVESPIYGNGRIGVHKRLGDSYVYELADHLGNVRTVFSKNGGAANTEGYSDYYPFGMPMPGRNMVGDYRYAFQGQEKDSETGKEAFQLRLWDSRIGRWLSPDPASQFASPYLGMGNNLIRMIDPDGGTCYDPQGNIIDCGEGNSNFEGDYYNLVSGDDFVIGTDHLRKFYNALDEVVVSAPRINNPDINGNLATKGNLLGGVIGLLNEHSIFQAQKGLPSGKFAVDFNGQQKIWSQNFSGGTRANISSDFVNAAKANASTARTVSKVAGYANFAGSVLGYYGAAENLYNGNYRGAATEAVGNRLSILAAARWGNAYGIAWTVGWEAGKVHGHLLDENIPGYVRYFKNPLRETFGFEQIPLPR